MLLRRTPHLEAVNPPNQPKILGPPKPDPSTPPFAVIVFSL